MVADRAVGSLVSRSLKVQCMASLDEARAAIVEERPRNGVSKAGLHRLHKFRQLGRVQLAFAAHAGAQVQAIGLHC